MLDKKKLGQRLFQAREAAGISRKELAQQLKITKTQICDIENGKSGTSLERLWELCSLYRVSADYFLGITDDPTWRGREESN